MNEIIPIIDVKNGINVVSSRTMAEQLGKEHYNVIRDIEQIITNLVNTRKLKFEFSENNKYFKEKI